MGVGSVESRSQQCKHKRRQSKQSKGAGNPGLGGRKPRWNRLLPGQNWPKSAGSRGDLAAQFVLDMGADNVVEGGLGRKAERQGAGRVEAARPAGDDTGDQRVG